MKKPRPVVNQKFSQAQRSKPCLICGEGGRTIGKMGKIDLNYCGHHRKYGERVLNFLINSVFGYKLSEFLHETKEDLFKKNMPELSDESYAVLAEYVNTMIVKLDEVQEAYKKTK